MAICAEQHLMKVFANTTAPRTTLEAETSGQQRKSRLKPPLKWAGGKRWLLPRLCQLWWPERHRRLVEPFCGGLAIALGLEPDKALLNDVNPHLINFYRWLKKGFSIKLRMENRPDVYYQHRTRFNRLLSEARWDTRQAAALFYYLNRTAYNGLCRFNSKGNFNVPFGRHITINYTSRFNSYRQLFTRFEFSNCDFAKLPLQEGDFIYADPPYDVQFTSYSKDGFTWEDQERTALWLVEHRGPVVLSNQATDRILGLYSHLGFKVHKITAPRMISRNGNRAPAQEVLATKNL